MFSRIWKYRFLPLSFIFLCVLLILKTGVNQYQKGLVVNGTAYQLLGDISIPVSPNYSCPYFKRLPLNVQPFRRKCHTCSVVSSSGRLLNSGAGQAIDSADCVFRINNASTEERYKADVGQKLSVRVLSSRGMDEYFSFLLTQPDVQPEDVLVWDANLRFPRLDRVSVKALKMSDTFGQLNLHILNNHIRGRPSFDTFIDREVGLSSTLTGSSCSSGFYAMVAAAYVCDEIHVFGMSPPDHCFKDNPHHTPYHYQPPYDKVSECDLFRSRWKRSIHGHRFMTEHMIFKRWSKHRPITFSVPSW